MSYYFSRDGHFSFICSNLHITDIHCKHTHTHSCGCLAFCVTQNKCRIAGDFCPQYCLEMLIQRDSVISWSSNSSSCYLRLPLLRHAPTLILLCQQSNPTSPRPSVPILLTISLSVLTLSTNASGACSCVWLRLCAEKWCSFLFLISPSYPPGCKEEIFCVYACRRSD